MDSQLTWKSKSDELSIEDSVANNHVILDNRLSNLRDVALSLLREVESLRFTEPVRQSVRLHDEVQRFEIELINSALSRCHGNQTQAAQILGVKLTTLNSKIKRFKIAVPGQPSTNIEATLHQKAA